MLNQKGGFMGWCYSADPATRLKIEKEKEASKSTTLLSDASFAGIHQTVQKSGCDCRKIFLRIHITYIFSD